MGSECGYERDAATAQRCARAVPSSDVDLLYVPALMFSTGSTPNRIRPYMYELLYVIYMYMYE